MRSKRGEVRRTGRGRPSTALRPLLEDLVPVLEGGAEPPDLGVELDHGAGHVVAGGIGVEAAVDGFAGLQERTEPGGIRPGTGGRDAESPVVEGGQACGFLSILRAETHGLLCIRAPGGVRRETSSLAAEDTAVQWIGRGRHPVADAPDGGRGGGGRAPWSLAERGHGACDVPDERLRAEGREEPPGAVGGTAADPADPQEGVPRNGRPGGAQGEGAEGVPAGGPARPCRPAAGGVSF